MYKIILCAPFFLSQLENINAAEVNCRESLFVTESSSSGEICFRRFQAQATQIGVKTLKSAAYMRTYAYGLFHSYKITLFAPSFLSELENINAVEVSCRETLH